MSANRCRIDDVSSYTHAPVGRLVAQQRDRARVLERFGVDYYCNGRMLLSEACELSSADLEEVVSALAESDAQPHNAVPVDWSKARLISLVNHIVESHHAYLREELPWLIELVDQLIAHNRENPKALEEVREVLSDVQNQITSHMIQEEQTVFSYIRRLERSHLSGQTDPQFQDGTVADLIGELEAHHPKAIQKIGQVRSLVDQYDAPSTENDIYRALMIGLEDIELDLHLHLHKESNILFERAVELESKMASINS